MAIGPLYDAGDVPVESPHPVFGKRPSLWTRLFGDEGDKYWPTTGDVTLFRRHMERVRNRETDANGWPVFDPFITGWTHCPSREWKARNYVKMVRDIYRRETQPTLEDEILSTIC